MKLKFEMRGWLPSAAVDSSVADSSPRVAVAASLAAAVRADGALPLGVCIRSICGEASFRSTAAVMAAEERAVW